MNPLFLVFGFDFLCLGSFVPEEVEEGVVVLTLFDLLIDLPLSIFRFCCCIFESGGRFTGGGFVVVIVVF
jgi:hypothetical protein